jgi:hypothetical protein
LEFLVRRFLACQKQDSLKNTFDIILFLFPLKELHPGAEVLHRVYVVSKNSLIAFYNNVHQVIDTY